MRILVTGSRAIKADDRPVLEDGLREAVGNEPGPHELVHGDAPGADQVFAQIARDWGWKVEPHGADWPAPCRETCKPGHRRPRMGGGTFCPAAENYRNQEMVDLGADWAVAAYKRGARNQGTSDCARRAGVAGIPVKRVTV